MKVGVVTFHKCINYGSYWQARCLVEGLQQRGHSAVLLDHDCVAVARAEIDCALQPTLPERTPRPLLPAYKAKVRRFTQAFASLPATASFPLAQPERAGRFDAIVVGSDEVWNFCHPWYANQPLFFGERVQADRLISYAASFGNHDADRGIDGERAAQIGAFDAVSVRDANSRRLIQSAVGRDPALVLDPCLQFADRIAVPAANEAAPYAVVYGHGFPRWLQIAAKQWSEAKGVPLVSIGYANAWADEQRIAIGPEQFASLMAGARAVITNFFHGCVFSLVSGRPFVAVRTEYRSNKLVDLTGQLGAEDRLIDATTDQATFDALLDEPPGKTTRERIREDRHRSESFLDAAFA